VDLPLRTVGPSEGAPLGAAMLAAVGAGVFGSVVDAGAAWLTGLDSVGPQASLRGAYDDAYGRYRALYPALREMFANFDKQS
jgi:sugar (pentulose or hexulose) kinase